MPAMHVSLWERLFLFIGIAIASAPSVPLGQNIGKFPNAHVLAMERHALNYDPLSCIFIDDSQCEVPRYGLVESMVLRMDSSTSLELGSIHPPCLSSNNWNSSYIQLARHTVTDSIGNIAITRLPEIINSWDPRMIDYSEFSVAEVLQRDRLQVVTHPDFDVPLLIKTAALPEDVWSLEHEAKMYQLLHGSGVTAEFLGYVTEDGLAIGFITEYIEEVSAVRANHMQNCLDALGSLHDRGIAHGDAHDGNCLIRKDGSAVLIDFELSAETWAREEFERDMDIMSRCIQETSGHS